MTAQRLLIRERVRAILSGDGKTSAATRVYKNRRRPYMKGSELPAIAVYTLSEEVEIKAQAPRVYRRAMRLAVECIAEDGPWNAYGSDDDVDDLAQAVEELLAEDLFFGLDEVQHTALESVDLDQDRSGERPLSAARLVYLVEYDSELPEGKPQLAQPWLRAGVEYDLPEGDPVDAADLIELEQT